ncbi:MAG: rhodanese-like domain-containing protein [Spirochaeta sp.]|nr:rhodanese-like domain-containing protein [Spirochaeta sp.]
MKRALSIIAALVAVVALAGCGPAPAGETGTEIVSAADALQLVANNSDAVLVDARPTLDYRENHVDGAVSIARADIVVNAPFPNLVGTAGQIENVMGGRGIGNDTLVVIYDDNNNMDSARLWWTLKYYGHDNVKVVSGGLQALQAEGVTMTTSAPSAQAASFTAAAPDKTMIATQSEIRDLIEEPQPGMHVIDTRTPEEYLEGTIPGAVLLNYTGNNFADGTYKPVRQIQIRYVEAGIDVDDGAVMFCKTSIRGAQTYLAMYNAGYRNLKLYDAAWVEWSSNPMNPVFIEEPEVLELQSADNS